MFLNRNFEFSGTIGNLDFSKGNYEGVYIIVLPNNFGQINFDKHSNSGKWRGQDPTVLVEKLQDKLVADADILYIGKSESKTVQKRMLKHIDFWNGESGAAWGGRAIGQIQNYRDLEVWYLKCDNPKETEKNLLKQFKAQYEKLPFANWRL